MESRAPISSATARSSFIERFISKRCLAGAIATMFFASGAGCAATAFPTPTVFAPGVISGGTHDSAPAFSPDGRTVYFSRSNPQGSGILVSHLSGESWSPPTIAAFSGEWNDLEPAMSPDGSFLIFVSNRRPVAAGTPLHGFFNGKLQPGQGGNLWRVDRAGGG